MFVFGAEGIDPLCLPPSLCDARCLKRVQVVPVPGRVATELSPGSPGCCWKCTMSSQLRARGKESQTKPTASAQQLRQANPLHAKSMAGTMPDSCAAHCSEPLSPFIWHRDPVTRVICRGWLHVGAAPMGGVHGSPLPPGWFSLLSRGWWLWQGSPPPGSFALTIEWLNAVRFPAWLCNRYRI